ncbi:isochorismatase family protein [Arthrobacter sp. MYb213]|uniref:cysteine hydrolase family protein n=1 Tax=Arthrobacter sp. MYb213 TaxID=1848595 RepID=UPI001C6163DD|nr:isochorismatase family protein [Arthrobacter sp. MYb213]
MVKQARCLVEGSDSATIIEALGPKLNDVVLTNQRIGGISPQLAEVLNFRGIDSLIIAGVATNISVESTALAAVDHGYHVMIAQDACAAATEHIHAASI